MTTKLTTNDDVLFRFRLRVIFALARPAFGPHRIAAELKRERWGGLAIGRARYERAPEARGSRNGLRPRRAQTADGELEVQARRKLSRGRPAT